ncbi:conserved Plasmodium protein, unknown function [Plasmodium ovale]|uniref:Uncharacterized protein n=2 Tax=Plasmodium ovale TaxID=36330 RepID=A0A1A8W4U3_PLAOA|nr:conserved Plasmodium protein, unknown function [Plasmodium ovale curtisi]SCP05990.1 conserved Plasmodium protein, unknown function [Plasmodium ovale]
MVASKKDDLISKRWCYINTRRKRKKKLRAWYSLKGENLHRELMSFPKEASLMCKVNRIVNSFLKGKIIRKGYKIRVCGRKGKNNNSNNDNVTYVEDEASSQDIMEQRKLTQMLENFFLFDSASNFYEGKCLSDSTSASSKSDDGKFSQRKKSLQNFIKDEGELSFGPLNQFYCSTTVEVHSLFTYVCTKLKIKDKEFFKNKNIASKMSLKKNAIIKKQSTKEYSIPPNNQHIPKDREKVLHDIRGKPNKAPPPYKNYANVDETNGATAKGTSAAPAAAAAGGYKHIAKDSVNYRRDTKYVAESTPTEIANNKIDAVLPNEKEDVNFNDDANVELDEDQFVDEFELEDFDSEGNIKEKTYYTDRCMLDKNVKRVSILDKLNIGLDDKKNAKRGGTQKAPQKKRSIGKNEPGIHSAYSKSEQGNGNETHGIRPSAQLNTTEGGKQTRNVQPVEDVDYAGGADDLQVVQQEKLVNMKSNEKMGYSKKNSKMVYSTPNGKMYPPKKSASRSVPVEDAHMRYPSNGSWTRKSRERQPSDNPGDRPMGYDANWQAGYGINNQMAYYANYQMPYDTNYQMPYDTNYQMPYDTNYQIGYNANVPSNNCLVNYPVAGATQNYNASLGGGSVQNGYVNAQNGYVNMQNGYVNMQNGYVDVQNGYADVQNGYVKMQSRHAGRQVTMWNQENENRVSINDKNLVAYDKGKMMYDEDFTLNYILQKYDDDDKFFSSNNNENHFEDVDERKNELKKYTAGMNKLVEQMYFYDNFFDEYKLCDDQREDCNNSVNIIDASLNLNVVDENVKYAIDDEKGREDKEELISEMKLKITTLEKNVEELKNKDKTSSQGAYIKDKDEKEKKLIIDTDAGKEESKKEIIINMLKREIEKMKKEMKRGKRKKKEKNTKKKKEAQKKGKSKEEQGRAVEKDEVAEATGVGAENLGENNFNLDNLINPDNLNNLSKLKKEIMDNVYYYIYESYDQRDYEILENLAKKHEIKGRKILYNVNLPKFNFKSKRTSSAWFLNPVYENYMLEKKKKKKDDVYSNPYDKVEFLFNDYDITKCDIKNEENKSALVSEIRDSDFSYESFICEKKKKLKKNKIELMKMKNSIIYKNEKNTLLKKCTLQELDDRVLEEEVKHESNRQSETNRQNGTFEPNGPSRPSGCIVQEEIQSNKNDVVNDILTTLNNFVPDKSIFDIFNTVEVDEEVARMEERRRIPEKETYDTPLEGKNEKEQKIMEEIEFKRREKELLEIEIENKKKQKELEEIELQLIQNKRKSLLESKAIDEIEKAINFRKDSQMGEDINKEENKSSEGSPNDKSKRESKEEHIKNVIVENIDQIVDEEKKEKEKVLPLLQEKGDFTPTQNREESTSTYNREEAVPMRNREEAASTQIELHDCLNEYAIMQKKKEKKKNNWALYGRPKVKRERNAILKKMSSSKSDGGFNDYTYIAERFFEIVTGYNSEPEFVSDQKRERDRSHDGSEKKGEKQEGVTKSGVEEIIIITKKMKENMHNHDTFYKLGRPKWEKEQTFRRNKSTTHNTILKKNSFKKKKKQTLNRTNTKNKIYKCENPNSTVIERAKLKLKEKIAEKNSNTFLSNFMGNNVERVACMVQNKISEKGLSHKGVPSTGETIDRHYDLSYKRKLLYQALGTIPSRGGGGKVKHVQEMHLKEKQVEEERLLKEKLLEERQLKEKQVEEERRMQEEKLLEEKLLKEKQVEEERRIQEVKLLEQRQLEEKRLEVMKRVEAAKRLEVMKREEEARKIREFKIWEAAEKLDETNKRQTSMKLEKFTNLEEDKCEEDNWGVHNAEMKSEHGEEHAIKGKDIFSNLLKRIYKTTANPLAQYLREEKGKTEKIKSSEEKKELCEPEYEVMNEKMEITAGKGEEAHEGDEKMGKREITPNFECKKNYDIFDQKERQRKKVFREKKANNRIVSHKGGNRALLSNSYRNNSKIIINVLNKKKDDKYEKGELPKGDAPNEDSPNGNSPNEDAPNGNSPNEDSPNGNSQNGDAPNGDTPKGEVPMETRLKELLKEEKKRKLLKMRNINLKYSSLQEENVREIVGKGLQTDWSESSKVDDLFDMNEDDDNYAEEEEDEDIFATETEESFLKIEEDNEISSNALRTHLYRESQQQNKNEGDLSMRAYFKNKYESSNLPLESLPYSENVIHSSEIKNDSSGSYVYNQSEDVDGVIFKKDLKNFIKKNEVDNCKKEALNKYNVHMRENYNISKSSEANVYFNFEKKKKKCRNKFYHLDRYKLYENDDLSSNSSLNIKKKNDIFDSSKSLYYSHHGKKEDPFTIYSFEKMRGGKYDNEGGGAPAGKEESPKGHSTGMINGGEDYEGGRNSQGDILTKVMNNLNGLKAKIKSIEGNNYSNLKNNEKNMSDFYAVNFKREGYFSSYSSLSPKGKLYIKRGKHYQNAYSHYYI